MARGAIAILSTENLLHNVQIVREKCGPTPSIIAMIKANAYGHGLRSVAKRLANKVDNLGVASIEEGLALRDIKISTPIILMEGVFEAEELLVAACKKFEIVIHEPSQVKWLTQTVLPTALKIWLKLNSGMGRLGFTTAQAYKIYNYLSKNKNLIHPIGVMSHMACAEDINNNYNLKQLQCFADFIKNIKGPKTLSNSAAIFNYPEVSYDAVRPGIALYGISPIPDKEAKDYNLKPVMTLYTNIIAINHMKKGDCVGYNCTYICPEDMRVGVIAIGYGDGYPRTMPSGTPTLVKKKNCPIIGRISMDMATIDLRNCPQAEIKDKVTLWGEDLPIEIVAKNSPHTPYELVCGIQTRVKFYWTSF